MAKLIPETLGITLQQAIEQSPELRARMESDGQVAQLVETGAAPRGTHAACVDSRSRRRHRYAKPLIEMVPLYRDPRSGDVVTQFDMRCVEKVGPHQVRFPRDFKHAHDDL